jgi:hypothetical protein
MQLVFRTFLKEKLVAHSAIILTSCLLRPCNHESCALRYRRLFVLVCCSPVQYSMLDPEPIIALTKLPRDGPS